MHKTTLEKLNAIEDWKKALMQADKALAQQIFTKAEKEKAEKAYEEAVRAEEEAKEVFAKAVWLAADKYGEAEAAAHREAEAAGLNLARG